MAAKALPSQDDLHQLLRYDAATGELFWRERDPKWFANTSARTAEHAAANWNSRLSGKPATYRDTTGYRRISIFNASTQMADGKPTCGFPARKWSWGMPRQQKLRTPWRMQAAEIAGFHPNHGR